MRARAAAGLTSRLLAGEPAALARAITLAENGEAGSILDAIRDRLGNARVIGITGPPGAGKSTLINSCVAELRGRGETVGVVAIDPSSPVSGGAILGDRIRMAQHSGDPGVFVRSLAARGHLGGLSANTQEIIDLMDAAGMRIVIVETVGTGQSEIEVAGVAGTNVVMCTPDQGDEVQALKAGVFEIADILVVNKSDQPLAQRTRGLLETMLELRTRGGNAVRVISTVATTGEGVEALVDAVISHAGRKTPCADTHGTTARVADIPAQLAGLATCDAFMLSLGAEAVSAAPGEATVRLQIQARHLNFNGTCHGGVIFALADSAFGLASNSRGAVATAIEANISFAAAAAEGDVLTATATEAARSRRLAVYNVEVRRGDGKPIAAFRGTVFITGKRHDSQE